MEQCKRKERARDGTELSRWNKPLIQTACDCFERWQGGVVTRGRMHSASRDLPETAHSGPVTL